MRIQSECFNLRKETSAKLLLFTFLLCFISIGADNVENTYLRNPVLPAGPLKGHAIDASQERPVTILTLSNAEAEKFGAEPGDIVIANFKHENRFWIARVPQNAVAQTFVGQEYQFPVIPFSIIPHLMLSFKMKPGMELELFPQNGDKKPKKAKVDEIFVSIDSARTKDQIFNVAKAAWVKDYGTVIRFMSGDLHRRFSMDRLHRKNLLNPLALSDAENQEVLKTALQMSSDEQYDRVFNTCGNSCTTNVYRILDTALGKNKPRGWAALSDVLATRVGAMVPSALRNRGLYEAANVPKTSVNLQALRDSQKAKGGRRTIIISDVDDTIKYTYMKGESNGNFISAYFNNLHPMQPLTGMPELYHGLFGNGHEIQYLTKTPAFLRPVHGRVLDFFPPGDANYIKKNDSSKTFKIDAIRRILEENPEADVVLVGDNGQKDQWVFESVLADKTMAPRVKAALIHRLYDRKDLKEGNGIEYFLTAAGLSMKLRQLDLITPGQNEMVLKRVATGLGTDQSFHTQKLTLPFFTKVKPEEVPGLLSVNSEGTGPENLTEGERNELTRVVTDSVLRAQTARPIGNFIKSCLGVFPMLGARKTISAGAIQ